jgi:hypothetical protein
MTWSRLKRQQRFTGGSIGIGSDRNMPVKFTKQSKANKENSKNSTGAKTPEGKAAVAKNALKHGLRAKDVVIQGEDPDEFKAFSEALSEQIEPEGPLEKNLVDRVASCLWRLRRADKLEAAVFRYRSLQMKEQRAKLRLKEIEVSSPDNLIEIDKPLWEEELAEEHSKLKAEILDTKAKASEDLPALGAAFVADALSSNALTKLSRYETAIERSMYRALHELQRLQSARSGGEVSVPTAVDVTIEGGPDMVEV